MVRAGGPSTPFQNHVGENVNLFAGWYQGNRVKKREGKQAVAFLKKSSAKNFCNLYTGCLNVPWPKGVKVFWFFFSKKNSFLG
jgi:hypothetical protein